MSSQHTKPLVVGIAGGSASGKTTLSNRLVEALADLKVEVFHMDRYFLKVKPEIVAPITRIVYSDHNHPTSFDLPGLVRDLDAMLASPEASQVIIIEGLMTLWDDDIRSRLDLKLFMDAQSDERIVRRIKRSMAAGGDYDQITAFFLDTVRYRHQQFVEPSRWHADLVLNGSSPSMLGEGIVVEWIRRNIPNGTRPEPPQTNA